jgi:hypothetical protein
MKIINYFFIAYFISILPANAQLFGGQIKTKNPLLNQYPAGAVFCNGPTAIVDVINPTTGKIWMDRNLGATSAATSSTDALAYGDLYQWGRRSDGHQCRNSNNTSILSSTDQPLHGDFILSSNNRTTPPFLDWRSPQNVNLWQGINGINNPCPIGYRIPSSIELDNERLLFTSQTNIGAFNSFLKLPAAGYRTYNGSLLAVDTYGIYWSSNVDPTYSFRLIFDSGTGTIVNNMSATPRASGISIRCIKDASAIPATVGALNCGSTSVTGTLTSGTAASGVSATVPYTGGNGGSYATQSISSTGVTGLTATLTSGILANGSGLLSLAISGTPSASETASFVLTIGGQTCSINISVANLTSLYPTGSIFCNGPTAIVDVINPTTGKTWMDRNLGAIQAATDIADTNAIGDLYQWGRRSDGHQCRNSGTTDILSSSDQPTHGFFITYNIVNTFSDWRSPSNDNLWQGVSGINNPCPNGYRLATKVEFTEELNSWVNNSAENAFLSPLKLTKAGYRWRSNGSINDVGIGGVGFYWTSTIYPVVSGSGSTKRTWVFEFGTGAVFNSRGRADAYSVRCIKN